MELLDYMVIHGLIVYRKDGEHPLSSGCRHPYVIVLFSLPQTLSEILFYYFTYVLFAYLVSSTRLLDQEEQRPFLSYSVYSQRLVHSKC